MCHKWFEDVCKLFGWLFQNSFYRQHRSVLIKIGVDLKSKQQRTAWWMGRNRSKNFTIIIPSPGRKKWSWRFNYRDCIFIETSRDVDLGQTFKQLQEFGQDIPSFYQDAPAFHQKEQLWNNRANHWRKDEVFSKKNFRWTDFLCHSQENIEMIRNIIEEDILNFPFESCLKEKDSPKTLYDAFSLIISGNGKFVQFRFHALFPWRTKQTEWYALSPSKRKGKGEKKSWLRKHEPTFVALLR